VAHLDRFPAVPGSRRRFVVVRSVGILAQECCELSTKRSKWCIASIIERQVDCTTKHRIKDLSRHRETRLSTIVDASPAASPGSSLE
jgi:hypothetical protein